MEYKCDMCGKAATVHITKIINGKKIKIHLCAECAQKSSDLASSGFPADIMPSIKKIEEQILQVASGKLTSDSTGLICSKCGTSFEDFEKQGRFSCPECYVSFKGKVFELLAQMHGAISHCGKRPKSASKDKKRLLDITVIDDRQIEIPFSDLSASTLSNDGVDVKCEEPSCDLENLKTQLENAIRDERYEDAAILRDKINAVQKH